MGERTNTSRACSAAESGYLVMAMDDIHARVPVNRMAAISVSTGVHWEPNKKIALEESDCPIETAPPPRNIALNPHFKDLTGEKFGRLTVVGLHATRTKIWVCRCSCGRYTTRRAKSVRNPENWGDRCALCQHLAYLKKESLWKSTGREVDVRGL